MRFKFLVCCIALLATPALAQETPAPVTAQKKTIAVLQDHKNIDELITKADVITLEVDKVPAGAIENPDDVIGKAPRRPINANQPIKANDLKNFIVVKKGEMVTIQLQTKSMNLTATGKALDNGTQNEMIRIVNVSSNRTIYAKVIGPNLVAIENAQ